eukprot:139972-Prorocentrum_minimum.AAC.1
MMIMTADCRLWIAARVRNCRESSLTCEDVVGLGRDQKTSRTMGVADVSGIQSLGVDDWCGSR